MSQESRPMVAGGRSSDEVSIGGFRRLFSSPAALPVRMVGRGERGGDGGPSWAGTAVRRWRDGGRRRAGGSSGSGRKTEEKRREKEKGPPLELIFSPFNLFHRPFQTLLPRKYLLPFTKIVTFRFQTITFSYELRFERAACPQTPFNILYDFHEGSFPEFQTEEKVNFWSLKQ